MDELVRNAIGGSVLLGAVAVLGLGRRYLAAGAVALVAAIGAVLALGWLPASAPGLDTLEPPALLLGALALGLAGRAADPWLPRSPGLAAALGGLLLGDIATAILLAPRCSDAKTAIRVALVASAAALASPIGTPATLVLGWAPDVAWLALPLVAVAWPHAGELTSGPNRGATGLLVALAGGCLALPELRLPLVVLAAAGLAVLGRGRFGRTPWAPALWIVGASCAAIAADHSGALAETWTGLGLLEDTVGPLALLATGAGFAAAALSGEVAATLLASGLTDTFARPGLLATPALVAGLAAGGLGPVLLARRSGAWPPVWSPLWVPWLGQLAVVMIWGASRG